MTGLALWVAVALAFSAYGWWRGTRRCSADLAALGAACILAGPAGWVVKRLMGGLVPLPPLLLGPVAVGMGAVIVAFLTGVTTWAIWRWRERSVSISKAADRKMGATLGAMEGVLMGLLVGWTFQLLHGPVDALAAMGYDAWVTKTILAVAENLDSSPLGAASRATNPVKESPLIALMGDFARIIQDERAKEAFLTDPHIREFMATPAVGRVAELVRTDPELREIRTDGRLWDLFTHPKLQSALNEEALKQELLRRKDGIERAVRRAAKLAGAHPPKAKPRERSFPSEGSE